MNNRENTSYEDYLRNSKHPGMEMSREMFEMLPDKSREWQENRDDVWRQRMPPPNTVPGLYQEFPLPNIKTIAKSPWTDQIAPPPRYTIAKK